MASKSRRGTGTCGGAEKGGRGRVRGDGGSSDDACEGRKEGGGWGGG